MATEIPHVWCTLDADGGECRHLAMCEEGAIQGHLLHHGMLGYDKEIVCKDEGPIDRSTSRAGICFDPHDVLYALSITKTERLK